MRSGLAFIGWALVLIGLAGAGLAFLWMQQEAPPSVAARTAGEAARGSPVASTPRVSATEVRVEPLTLLFDFDRTALRPAEAASLDRLADGMKGTRLGRLKAIGYADRIGSDAYNLALSQQRAETVKSYLASRGLDAAALDIVATGERMPVSGADCGPASPAGANAQLIECLQPDRRVVVTVSYTQ